MIEMLSQCTRRQCTASVQRSNRVPTTDRVTVRRVRRVSSRTDRPNR